MKTYQIRNCKYQYFDLWHHEDTIIKSYSGFRPRDLNPKTELALQYSIKAREMKEPRIKK